METPVRTRAFDGAFSSLRWPEVDGTPPGAPARKQIVLVAGLGLSSEHMRALGDALATEFSVWAVDLPGARFTRRPARSLDVPALGRALSMWLECAQLRAPLLCGVSFGCQVITESAASRRVPLAGLVLASPTMDPSGGLWFGQAWRMLLNAAHEHVSSAAEVLADYRAAGPSRVLATYGHALADPVATKFPRIEVPVLVIRGARDPLVSQKWAERVAESVESGDLAVVADAGHTLNQTHPHEVAALTAHFAATRCSRSLKHPNTPRVGGEG